MLKDTKGNSKEITVKFEFSLSEIRFLKLALGRIGEELSTDEEFDLLDSIEAKLNGEFYTAQELINKIAKEHCGR